MAPLVSCVLATTDRHRFFARAVKNFQRQDFGSRELVVVDDGKQPVAELVPDDPRIRYIRLSEPRTLGYKLNAGIDAARGRIIQKFDDDDYYHPEFLSTTVVALEGHDPARALVAFDCFLVLVARTGHLTFSGHGWCAGATFCFDKALWRQRAFRDQPRAVDWRFLEDTRPERIKIRKPHLFIHVRHGLGHLWRKMGANSPAPPGDYDVTGYFQGCARYRQELRTLVPREDFEFYDALRREAAGARDDRAASA